MKTVLSMAIWILIISDSLAAPISKVPTKQQIDKLIDAVCKNPPSSVDITFNVRFFRKPMSEEQIRNMFEDALSRPDRPKEKMSDRERKQFEKDVKSNMERTLKEQATGVNMRERVRLTGKRERIDRVAIKPSDPNSAYNGTFIYSERTIISCYPSMKTVEISQRKGEGISNSDITNIISPPLLGLRSLLTDKQQVAAGNCVSSAKKIDALATIGKIDDTEVSICPEPNATQSKVHIELKGNNGIVRTICVCDKDDYSRAYYTEIRMPFTGQPLYIRECNDFDVQGIPRNVDVTEYNIDGSLGSQKIYNVEDVNLNPIIPDDVFKFNPPEDYKIVEVEPNGVRKIIREHGGIEGAMQTLLKAQKAEDINTLLDLLNSDIWQVRLRALQVLEYLLRNDNEQLREAASLIKDDTNDRVREEARRTLKRLDQGQQNK
jgi:hypothetical protein